jgi:hypothetical protein
MFDVFYIGKKPNLFPHEQPVDNINQAIAQCRTRYCWIVRSHIDYQGFDWMWEPTVWETNQKHVWPSQHHQDSGTWLVPKDGFNDINYHKGPILTSIIDMSMWDTPTGVDLTDFDFSWHPNYSEPKYLYQFGTKTSGPRFGPRYLTPDAVEIKFMTQEYFHYDDTDVSQCDRPLDIVFISNGESIADKHYQKLCQCVKDKPNRIVRIDKVDGRVNAYRAALESSQTPWAFCVFAKLEIDCNFDWNWRPDSTQPLKHYIFHAHNPVNHLEYGHQALIAYNKSLVLCNQGIGLDFTLDQPHETIPILSGIAHYNLDPWTAWRTAFRECIKLKYNKDSISQYRLSQWLNIDYINDSISCYSLKGAQDAVDYYQTVSGNFSELKKSYSWVWLSEYAIAIGSLTRSQII